MIKTFKKLSRKIRARFRRDTTPVRIEAPKVESREFSRKALFMALGATGLVSAFPPVARSASIPPVLLYDQMINVKNFKAKGDGSDDTAFIQAALNQAVTDKTYCVFLPPPSTFYGISNQLNIPIGVSLVSLFSSNSLFNSGTAGDFAVTTIKALTGFPVSTPMLNFAQGWTGRFENILLDGASIATCGFSWNDVRGAFIANIGVQGLGNNLGSDYAWLMKATTFSSSLNTAINVNFNKYNMASHTNGLVCVGTITGGVEIGAVTDNLFLNCDLSVQGSGTAGFGNGYGLNLAIACDNNNFNGCFITINGVGDAICLNNQGTYDALVGQNYFTNCAVAGAAGSNMIVADFNYGPNVFDGGFFQSAQFLLGTHSWVDMRKSTFGDAPTLPAGGVTLSGSPFTFVNNKGCPVTCKFWGGAFSAISIRRRTGAATTGGIPTTTVALGVVSGAYYDIWLEPWDAIIITYSVSPTMFYFPQR